MAKRIFTVWTAWVALTASAWAAPTFQPIGKTEHNFGTVSQGDVVEYVFKFKNSGTDTLQISSVKGS